MFKAGCALYYTMAELELHGCVMLPKTMLGSVLNQIVLLRKMAVTLFVCVLERGLSLNVAYESLLIFLVNNTTLLQPPFAPICIRKTSYLEVEDPPEWLLL